MTKRSIAIVYNASHSVYLYKLSLIHNLQNLGFTIYAIAPYDNYVDKLKEQNIRCVNVIMDSKGTNPIADTKLVYKLYKIYKKISPNVILHFTIKPNIYGSLAARMLNIPVINNITGLGTVYLKDDYLQTFTNILYKISFFKVEKVFFQNNDDKILFLNNKIIKEKKAEIIPGSGVDTINFYPRKKIRSSSELVFLMIARVIRDKGIVEFIDAAKNLQKKYKNVQFQLIGRTGAANRSAISKEEIDVWCESKIINYLGEKEDVREYIANADCVVLPSYREGTSRVLLEAAAMARPIITTDVPGCKNTVIDGVSGFLCRVKNSSDLQEKMEKMIILSDKERLMMGLNGRKMVMEHFDETIVINKYIAAIEELFQRLN